MDENAWKIEFKRLYDLGAARYKSGQRSPRTWFSASEVDFLKSVGCTVQELFDLVEDQCQMGEPSFETTLRMAALRRDYLLKVQHGQHPTSVVDMDKLPPKPAPYGGVPWLPRIIAKAQAKLRGEMPPELMYCCGGDRAFLEEHGLDAADFLEFIWRTKGDPDAALRYVKSGGKAA